MIHATLIVSARRRGGRHRIVSWGVNHLVEGGGSIHSEVDALRKVRCPSRTRLVLLNARISRTGVVNMSRPCAACARLISYRSDIVGVYWTDHNHRITTYQ